MSSCEYDSDSSVENIDIRPVRPAPRASQPQQRDVAKVRSPRSHSPNSVINGDGILAKKVLDVIMFTLHIF